MDLQIAVSQMRKGTIIFVLLLTSSGMSSQKDKLKIEAAVWGFFNGLSLINTDTLKYYTTEDFHLLEGGQVWTLDTLINKIAVRKNTGFQRINKLEFIRTEQSGESAWVSYNNTADITVGEKQTVVRWLESAVLVKRNGRWRIQMLHSTKLK